MSDASKGGPGTPVSKDQVIASLGRPSIEWARAKRHNFLRAIASYDQPDETEDSLDIAGIRGFAGLRNGFLHYLTEEYRHPAGVGTGLISPEEDALIRAELALETDALADKCHLRLRQHDADPAQIARFIDRLKRELAAREKVADTDYTREPTEDLAQQSRMADSARKREIEILQAEIENYTAYQQALLDGPFATDPACIFVRLARDIAQEASLWYGYLAAIQKLKGFSALASGDSIIDMVVRVYDSGELSHTVPASEVAIQQVYAQVLPWCRDCVGATTTPFLRAVAKYPFTERSQLRFAINRAIEFVESGIRPDGFGF